MGFGFIVDTRDHTVDTHHGNYFQARLDVGPSFLSSRPNGQTFARLDTELRSFWQPASWLVLATQLAAGVSVGEPGLLFRYTLGGASRMRGYAVNRLRGKQYYMAQGETRFRPLRWLGLVGFAAVGDAAANDFSDFDGPKLTYGAGIRLGLPPDLVAKVRLDFAFSRDQSGFYLNFNEAF